jgi:histidyl-tRNA synthetase
MQPLPGFRDFYPEDLAFRQSLLEICRGTARRYGFQEYDGPPLEPLDLYKKKSGEELLGQLYQFIDKGERSVALRPEMTPTLARMVAAKHRDYKKPLKWFSVPQVFRYERQQKGRLREHYQFNADIIGEPSLGAEVELVALLIDTLRNCGLTSADVVVRMSDRQFWLDFLRTKNVPEDQWYAVFQAIDKSEREPEEKSREALGALADDVFQVLREGAPSERLTEVMAGLRARGLADFARVDFRIVRGLAYYTGIVFEVFDRQGEFRAIAGGGRYDDLLEKFGNEALPALGFGMGDVVIGELLKARGKSLPNIASLELYVIIAEETYRSAAGAVVQQFRDAGFSVDYSLAETKFKKQMEAATYRGVSQVIIVDEKILQDVISVKNLITREQIDLSLADALQYQNALRKKQ